MSLGEEERSARPVAQRIGTHRIVNHPLYGYENPERRHVGDLALYAFGTERAWKMQPVSSGFNDAGEKLPAGPYIGDAIPASTGSNLGSSPHVIAPLSGPDSTICTLQTVISQIINPSSSVDYINWLNHLTEY